MHRPSLRPCRKQWAKLYVQFCMLFLSILLAIATDGDLPQNLLYFWEYFWPKRGMLVIVWPDLVFLTNLPCSHTESLPFVASDGWKNRFFCFHMLEILWGLIVVALVCFLVFLPFFSHISMNATIIRMVPFWVPILSSVSFLCGFVGPPFSLVWSLHWVLLAFLAACWQFLDSTNFILCLHPDGFLVDWLYVFLLFLACGWKLFSDSSWNGVLLSFWFSAILVFCWSTPDGHRSCSRTNFFPFVGNSIPISFLEDCWVLFICWLYPFCLALPGCLTFGRNLLVQHFILLGPIRDGLPLNHIYWLTSLVLQHHLLTNRLIVELVFIFLCIFFMACCRCTRMAWAMPAVLAMSCPGLLCSHSGSLSPCLLLGLPFFSGTMPVVALVRGCCWFLEVLRSGLTQFSGESSTSPINIIEWPISHPFHLSCLCLSLFPGHSHIWIDATVTSG